MRNRYALIVLLLVSLPIITASVSAQSDNRCNPIQDTQICIQDVNVSRTTVDVGNRTEVTLEVQNFGNRTGDAVVIISIRQPEGGHDYYRAEEIHNIEPGDTQTASVIFPMGEPAGVHEMNVLVFDQAEQHLYDASGYYQKIVVEQNEGSFNPISWFNSLGTIAQSALSIVSLATIIYTRKFVSNRRR